MHEIPDGSSNDESRRSEIRLTPRTRSLDTRIKLTRRAQPVESMIRLTPRKTETVEERLERQARERARQQPDERIRLIGTYGNAAPAVVDNLIEVLGALNEDGADLTLEVLPDDPHTSTGEVRFHLTGIDTLDGLSASYLIDMATKAAEAAHDGEL